MMWRISALNPANNVNGTTEIEWKKLHTLENGNIIEFQEKYRNRGFATVGISMDADGWAVVKPYLETSKINYPIVVRNDDVAKQYGVGSMPMTYLIDRNGKIAATYVGLVDKNNCENVINRLLSK